MRIIDKNTDFYDYLQDIYPDNSLVFDRRDSFLLTKQLFCRYLRLEQNYSRYGGRYKENNNYALLQICNTFWLFGIKIEKIDEYDQPVDYTVELLKTWKNYNKQRKLISLDIIDFGYRPYFLMRDKSNFKNKDKKLNILTQLIDTNDYKIWRNINLYTIYPGNDYTRGVNKHIPLLKACGIANCIDPLDVFLSLEEYFSLEKTASERRDPIGSTDMDKLKSHGFDAKVSFRGRQE